MITHWFSRSYETYTMSRSIHLYLFIIYYTYMSVTMSSYLALGWLVALGRDVILTQIYVLSDQMYLLPYAVIHFSTLLIVCEATPYC
jgi:hypothetical protein